MVAFDIPMNGCGANGGSGSAITIGSAAGAPVVDGDGPFVGAAVQPMSSATEIGPRRRVTLTIAHTSWG
jgi:hypothetical protein